jgi:hypothetical protein
MPDNIKIKVNQNNIKVRVGQQNSLKVISSSLGGQSLGSLSDVDTTNAENNYIMVYNSSQNKYEFVNPDDVLIAAVNEPNRVGLPTEFISALDNDLDNKIDVDAGNF